jgi:hypothetical protein
VAREQEIYHRADVRIFVSDVERNLYQSLPGAVDEHNLVIPIIVDEKIPQSRTPCPGEVMFVGALWHAPNLDGVTWFCSDVWPLVRAARPDAELRLIGSNPWSLPIDIQPFTASPGVTAVGFVPDLGAAYARAAVAVAPLRFGAGMKAKVCAAMAAGVPVVTTTVGAEGIQALPGQDLLVGDDAEAFANAVAALLSDNSLAATVGAAGAVAVRLQCGTEVVRPVVHSLLDSVNGSSAPVIGATSPAMDRFRTRQIPRLIAAAGWRLMRRSRALLEQLGK